MITFPRLKSGAVAQYPAERSVARRTWVGRFVDGTEQRFRTESTVLHRWVVSLALLTEAEAVAIREFIDAVSGRFGSFSFTDPWDGTVYSSCSLENDINGVECEGENSARTKLVIRENRS